MKTTIAAFIIGFKGGLVAATTRPAGGIGLPGGKLEAGETPAQAALREAQEEGFIFPLETAQELVFHERAIVAGKQVEFFITATTPEITTKGFKEKGRITPIFTTPEILRATGMGNKCIPTQKQFEKFQELLGQAQEALYA